MLPIEKLESLRARRDELDALLCEPEIAGDSRRFTSLMKERSDIDPLVSAYTRYREVQHQLAEMRTALEDAELRDLASEEIPVLEQDLSVLTVQIEELLLPTDPN